VNRDGILLIVGDDRMPPEPGERPQLRRVRFRTLGCYPLTGAVESDADTLDALLAELLVARTSERRVG
jgi:sulfate adenylyltransferase subunit 2